MFIQTRLDCISLLFILFNVSEPPYYLPIGIDRSKHRPEQWKKPTRKFNNAIQEWISLQEESFRTRIV